MDRTDNTDEFAQATRRGEFSAMDRRMRPHMPKGHRWDMVDAVINTQRVGRDTEIPSSERAGGAVLHIMEGLAYSCTTLADGRRHIEDMFGSGAICNWKLPVRAALPYSLMLKAGTTIMRLDLHGIERILKKDQFVAEAFRRLDLSRQWRLRQRNRTLISGAIHDGLMHVMLDLNFETHGSFEQWGPMRMQLTQEEISAILGSSTVHVNRTVKKLEADGRLRRRNRVYEIADPAGERSRLAYDTPAFPPTPDYPNATQTESAE